MARVMVSRPRAKMATTTPPAMMPGFLCPESPAPGFIVVVGGMPIMTNNELSTMIYSNS